MNRYNDFARASEDVLAFFMKKMRKSIGIRKFCLILQNKERGDFSTCFTNNRSQQ